MTVTDELERESTTAAPPRAAYRPDLDGMRALAILAVVLFHARVDGFEGGFVGVDVFFVLSGWLISRQLVAPVSGAERLSLTQFWARRVRRLVPAMALMIVVVLVASLVVLSPLEWHLIAARGAAAALYVSNLLFARSAGDYFAGPLQDSPFLHTWSLGVEEQFYLVWPLLFWVCAAVSRRSGARTGRGVLLAALGLVGVTSFAVSELLVRDGSAWGFYGLPSRAWEFAVGGMIAVAWPHEVRWRGWLPRVGAVVGLALVLLSVFTYDESMSFPGTAALLPVVGTMAMILGLQADDARDGWFHRGLTLGPVRELGRLSYSWYLWHWPFIVLAIGATYRDTVALRVAACVAALPVAMLSLRVVEMPVRQSRRLTRSRSWTFALGLVVTGLVVSAAVGLELYDRRQLRTEPYKTYERVRASFDDADCRSARTAGGIGYCLGGDAGAPKTVVLIGDSHARQWTASFTEAAEGLDARIVLRQAPNCPSPPIPDPASDDQDMVHCAAYQRDTQRLLDEIEPDAVVLSDARLSRDLGFRDDEAAWARSMRSFIGRLQEEGIAVGAVVDGPRADDPLACLARGRAESFCTPERVDAMAFADRYAEAEDAAYGREGSAPLPLLDLTDELCGPEVCPLQHDDVWVFAATNHLTKDYTVARSGEARALLRELLVADDA